MNNLIVFNNKDFGDIRVIEIDNSPWFVGEDIVNNLGYDTNKNSYSKYIKRFCEEDDFILVDKTQVHGGLKEFNYKELGQRGGYIINESAMYSLIISSELPSAKKFKKWVTSDVLPNIRKHGGYVANDELFLNTYLPYADEQTKLFFKTTLSTIQDLNNEIAVLKPKAEDYDLLTNKHNAFDMNSFAKILNISGLGRNNMFAYLRGQNILMTGVRENQPYQRYMQWFEVTTVYTPKGWKEKTLVKPQGVSGILKHLKKDGYVPTTLNPKDIIEQLEKEINTYDN